MNRTDMIGAWVAIAIVILLFILVCYRVANAFGADIGKSWG